MPTPKTILIIDDDDDLREALAEQLALHEAFRPVQASTAAEGVRMGREVRADLILLDVDLPDMDGREACRLLRKDGVSTPDHHADRPGVRLRHRPWAGVGGQ